MVAKCEYHLFSYSWSPTRRSVIFFGELVVIKRVETEEPSQQGNRVSVTAIILQKKRIEVVSSLNLAANCPKGLVSDIVRPF